MLYQPSRYGEFARYSYANTQITLGYEYEDADLTAPPMSYYSNEHRDQRRQLTHNIQTRLPNYFKVEYEGFGNGSGCEIKSVVAPLFLHKQFWNRYISKLPLYDGPNADTITDGGIHVSVSRTPFTEQGKMKVFNFLHDLLNRPSFFKLSKRTQHNFDCYAPSHPNPSLPRVWTNHYNIINQENSNRYEFRLFAAHPTLLLPALEMCDSLFMLAPEVNEINFTNFRKYITKFSKY